MTATDAATPSSIRTTTIDVSRDCPSVEPISGPYRFERKDFSPEELAIAGVAIDAGMFYETDSHAFCKEAWSALHPEMECCLTRTDEHEYEVAPQTTAARRERLRELDGVLRSATRGTWFLLRSDWSNEANGCSGTTWFQHVADGAGDVHEVQTGPIWHNHRRAPDYSDAIGSMVRMEIYRVLLAERARREAARSRAVVKANGWAQNQKLRNVKIGSGSYSSGIISELHDDGTIGITLRKRGSRNAWVWRGYGQAVKADDVLPSLPAYGQLFSTTEST